MTTGKTVTPYEFHCEHMSADIWCREGCHAESDRVRLERKVIEAAKKWRHDKTFKSDGDLFNAVCALLAFEAEHK